MSVRVDDLPFGLHNIFIIVWLGGLCCVSVCVGVCTQQGYSCEEGLQSHLHLYCLIFIFFEAVLCIAMDTFPCIGFCRDSHRYSQMSTMKFSSYSLGTICMNFTLLMFSEWRRKCTINLQWMVSYQRCSVACVLGYRLDKLNWLVM